MILFIIFQKSALLVGIADFLLPCPIKSIFGVDCPGCGFQRAIIALLKGNFAESFRLYPPAGLFIVCFLAASSAYVFKLDSQSKLFKGLYILTGIAVFVNYGYKLFFGHL